MKPFSLPRLNSMGGLGSRLGTALLALLLAFIVWVVSVQQENPFETRIMSRVPVTVRNLPESLVLVDAAAALPAVEVRVRAPRSVWETLTLNDLEAFIDLSTATPGRQEWLIQVEPRLSSVEAREVIPAAVVMRTETKVVRQIDVTAIVIDSAPFGYEAATPIITPTLVSISGAESQVNAVQQAEINVRLLGSRSPVQGTEFVTLRSRTGVIITGLEIDPRTVSVLVPIQQKEDVAEKTVLPRITGQPAAGYQLAAITVEPTSVRLVGDQTTLAAMPAFVETISISIEGAIDDVVERVALVLPETVSTLTTNTVIVTVDIEPIRASLTVTLRPVIQGLGPNLAISAISPPTLDVILHGPIPRLQALTADQDARAVLELSNLGAGVHTIVPILILPEGVSQQTVLPDSVQVTILPVTPTPTPGTPTPTPKP